MKSALFAAAAAVVAVGAIAGSVGVNAGVAQQAAAAQHVDNFQLTDHTRYAHDLHYYKYKKAVVIMTSVHGSAASVANAAKLERLSAANPDVQFFMLDSNPAFIRDAVAADARARGITIPILMDELQLVGEALNVQREGEVFVLDPKTWNVAYHGNVDQAAQAIEAVSAGRAPATAQVAVNGAAINLPGRANRAQFANISYARDVAPVIQEKCVSCHLEGGIGPFTLDSYDVVKGYAPMIRETLRTRRMPPYFADPHIGVFNDSQGLTADETKMLVHWIEAGTPRGEGADPLLANRGKKAPEWPEYLGAPDVVVNIPAYNVPATGLVDYQNQRVANPFNEDTFVRAIAVKPGDRRVLHHIVSNHVPDRTRQSSGLPGGSVGSYTPGARAQVIGDGGGAPIPGGGMLNYQMHYTTFGQESRDATQVGYYILKTPPTFIKRSTVISDGGLRIPAGEMRHREVSYMTAPADMLLYTLYPHAHYRGYHVELKMITPDGKEQMMLSLPRYDFNWQRDYDPAEPILIKAGTKLVATWEYNNSEHHFANPDPKIDVTWGEQSHEEMMYFRINYRFVDETPDRPRNDLQAALSASSRIGSIDDNVDGLIQVSELRGNQYANARQTFAVLDRDGNGGLDATEMAAIQGGGMRGGRGGGQQAAQPAFEVPDL